jgi:hypothetical protein
VVLDASGNPVISYYDDTNGDLKVAHCDDPDCAGSGESIETVDTTGEVGLHTSVVLDASGNPVISYHDFTNGDRKVGDLKVAHCDDPDCAGGGESIETVDSTGNVGWFTSVVLDASGNPVISYYDLSNGDLKVAHCDDPDCAGGGESIETVDTTGNVGLYPSVVSDASGNPVISYYDATNGDLKVAHG